MDTAKNQVAIVIAGRLNDALQTACPEGKRNKAIQPVTLKCTAKRKFRGVSEARYGLASLKVPAIGRGRFMVQVNGSQLRQLTTKYGSNAASQLVATSDALTIRYGKSQVSLPRLDVGGRGIVQEPPPKPKGHIGPVVAQPDAPNSGRFPWNGAPAP